jgi:hypothetical protein
MKFPATQTLSELLDQMSDYKLDIKDSAPMNP